VSRSDRRERRVPWLVIGIAVVALVAFLFLRGPYGLVSIFSRQRRIRRTEAELKRLEREVDSLRVVDSLLTDPAFSRDYARRCFEAGAKPDSGR
jgi:cell division protein FtsB